MPYLEIISPLLPAETKQRISRSVTEAVVAAFDVKAVTVTVFFQPLESSDYAHAGKLWYEDGRPVRVLIKVHAYRRDVDARRRAAAHITAGFNDACAPMVTDTAVYFFDRDLDEVAHDGMLASDHRVA
ncbi:tautomerase family protein [Robbsia andropogonis]|uniref:tautomerase family protein n=1 Tax=Robbsia andropogonis TaxID=28092 RepID=UPI003D23DA7F